MQQNEEKLEQQETEIKPKKQKFSYSKIGCFEQCKYKYKLIYKDYHFVDDGGSIATDFGTLIHYVEETMARGIVNTHKIDDEDYNNLINLLYNADIHEGHENIIGVNLLKQKYPVDWYTPDKQGRTYDEKVQEYVTRGIYRLRDMLIKNPDLKIVGIEDEFNLEFRDYIFHGFIDRFFQDTATGHYYIEDLKTWSAPADQGSLTTPLQFVIYSLALQDKYGIDSSQISCAYELPLCNEKQAAGTKGYMARGLKKLNKILDEIEECTETSNWTPSPSPLCHWCVFSATKPNQPEDGKNLCPYFSHWTKTKKDFSVENEWMGPENHDAILERFIELSKLPPEKKKQIMLKPDIEIKLGKDLATDKISLFDEAPEITVINTKTRTLWKW